MQDCVCHVPRSQALGLWENGISKIKGILQKLRTWAYAPSQPYWEGQVFSNFVACDVRREILVVSVERIDEGILTVRVRTSNLLYQSKGLVPEAEYGPPVEIEALRINELWHWTGESWGGLPDGTSIADHAHGPKSD